MPSPSDPTAGAPRPFRGFRSPNYTQVPDELFDELLAELSGAELKVLLYIIRRTFGFKRESDNISLSQMLNGLSGNDGRPLDRGVGLSKKPLLSALRTLAERRIIVAERRRSAERGDEPTVYRINMVDDDESGPGGDESPSPRRDAPRPLGGQFPQGESSDQADPVVEKLHHPPGGVSPPGGHVEMAPPRGGETPPPPWGSFSPSPWGRNSPTQETVLRQTVKGETEHSTRFDLPTLNITNGSELNLKKIAPFVYVQSGVSAPDLPAQSAPVSAAAQPTEQPSRPTMERAEPTGHRSAVSEQIGDALESPGAGRRAPLGGGMDSAPTESHRGPQISRSAVAATASLASCGRPATVPPRIAVFVEQLSSELHDDEHTPSNVGQAARLWRRSGLSEADFVGRLLEARARAKARGNIQKRATGEAGDWGLTNRMPYFFACLRELLGEARPPPAGP